MSDIKFSSILTAEQMEHLLCEERAGTRGLVEKEPLAIWEQFRVEKVGDIERDGINRSRQEVHQDDAKKEKSGSIYETNTVEVTYPSVVEPVLQEICVEGKNLSRSGTDVRDMTGMVSHLSVDMDQYLGQRPVVKSSSQEDLVQDTFEQLIVKRDGKRRPPDIKKPIRKKLRDRERSGCSSSEGELERVSSEESLDGDAILKESVFVPTTVVDLPVSPSVVETPIGSIKDRVKALQNKVEEMEVQKTTQKLIPQAKSSITTKKTEADMPELPSVPKSPKSPRSQTERLEETMSVKDLLKAFQTGQDPSKNKAGLFEHKAVASPCISTLISESREAEEVQKIEQGHMCEPKSQIHDLTVFTQQTVVEISDKTDSVDPPVGLIKKDSEESPFISESAYTGKTVTFADTVQVDDGSLSPQRDAPELSGNETMSVKKLMKTFQSGHDHSKGLFDHQIEDSGISTLISKSGDSDKIQKTDQSHMKEPKSQKPVSQTPTQDSTLFHEQSNVKNRGKTDLDDQPASSIKDSTEDSQMNSSSAYFGKAVTFADAVQRDGGKLSPQREAPDLSRKETVSVKELMKTFQTGHDPLKTKAGFIEEEGKPSYISSLVSESGDSKETKSTEERPTQEPESQTQTQKVKTDLEDQPVSLSRDHSENSLLISNSGSLGKTVKFADTIQCDDGGTQRQTLSVKELMKAFDAGHGPLSGKSELFEHKAIASSCIPTLITESVGPEQFQKTKQGPAQEPKSQTISLKRDDSEEPQLASDIAYFGDTETIADAIHFDDGRVSPQREEQEVSGKVRGRMHLEEPVISTGRSLYEDIQISPDRRPSEDFSADIKAELEESPEYQLFKQASTAADVSHQLEAPEVETLADNSVTSPVTISSHCMRSYFGADVSLFENQMRGDELSPESPKHEGMAETSDTSVHFRVHLSNSGENDNNEDLTLTREMSKEMLTFSTRREEKKTIHPHEEELCEVSKENTILDHGGKILCTQTDTEVTEDKIEEPLLQEVDIGRKTSSGASTAVKDMSGMLSLMNSDLDQYLQARPMASQTPKEDVVQEKFEQITITKDKDQEMVTEITFVTDGKKEAIGGSTTQLTEEVPVKEERVVKKTSYQPSTEVKEMSGMLSLLTSDLDKHLKDKPKKSLSPEEDTIQERFEQVILTKIPKSSSEEQRITVCEKTQSAAAIDVEDTIHGGTHEHTDMGELTPSNSLETPYQEVCINRKTHHHRSRIEKDMSGMFALLTSDLDQHLKEKPVVIQSLPEEDLVQERYKQVILTSSNLEDEICEEENEHMQTDEVGVTESSPGSVSETAIQEVYIERKTQHQQSTTEKDMSGMLSLLSSDLDQHLKEKPVAIQSLPEEDLVQESYKQVILTSSNLEDEIGEEENENVQTDEVGVTELSPGSVLETEIQEVYIERKTQHQQSTTEKDMSGMLSLLSSDLDRHLKEKPVAILSLPEENLVQESYKQVILTSSNLEDEIGEEENENVQTDEVGVTELSPGSLLKTEIQEVYIERKTKHQQPTTERDMSGMLSLLSSDLDQHLKEKPVAIQSLPEEDLVQESYKQVILTSSNLEDEICEEENEHMQTDEVGVTESSPGSVSETAIQEVYIERKIQHQQPTTEKDMSGMLSLLSSDLDRHLKEKPVAIQSLPEEDLVQESYKQVIQTSSNLEDEICEEENEHMQTDEVGVTESSPGSVSETAIQEVYIERKIQHQQPTTEKDMSGMLSLLSSDLDRHLKEKPVAIQSLPEEDLVQESYKQVIQTSSNLEDEIGEEENKHVQTDKVGVTELSPGSVLETAIQEVYIERKTEHQKSTTEKDMSGMLSLLSSDLDQHLKEKPVAIQSLPEEDLVQESYKQVILTSSNLDDKISVEQNEHMQTDEVGVTELSPNASLETPYQEVCINRKTLHHRSRIEKDLSGMFALLTSDMDQYLKEKPGAIESLPEENLVQESYKQVIQTSSNLEDEIHEEENEHTQTDEVGVTESSPGSVLETAIQEVYIERKTQHQQSTTERDMSGMLSLLRNDLDQHLKEKPVAIQSLPEEDLVQESYKQVIRTSSNLEDEIGLQENEVKQADEVGVTELSPGSVLETAIQEVYIERKTQQQQSTTERDMSGMLSLLSNDLDQHLNEKPVAIQSLPEEDLVQESYRQVILTKDTKKEMQIFCSEHEMMSPEDTNINIVDINKKRATESKWQKVPSHEGPKSFSSEEEGEGQTSPTEASPFSVCTEGTEDITKPYAAMYDYENDDRDVSLVAADSILKQHKFGKQPSSSDTPQRPSDLENLSIVVFDDLGNEPCHPDSLEASPLMEDRSSKTSLDSIEPSPARESPCRDSLEGSPTQPKDTVLERASKTAVYEDYASQLEACFVYDKNIYRDESGHDEQENNCDITQMDREMKNKYYCSETGVTDDMCPDSKIHDSENLHTLIRQDSLDEIDREDDTTEKQFTPEEEMFKMAAKIKTFEEMEQEAKTKRDKSFDVTAQQSETGDHKDDELNLKCGPDKHSPSQETLQTKSEKFATESTDTCSLSSKEKVENQSQLMTMESVSSSSQDMMCAEELECEISSCQGENDEGFNAQVEAKAQINLFHADDRKTPDKTPVRTPADERSPDPFQYQEGKLFEMTRGGAIDMTRRSFEEEGEGYAFFHIGEHPVDEVVQEETGEDQTKSLTLENSDSVPALQEVQQSSVTQGVNDKIPTPKPRTLIRPSSDKSESKSPFSEADLGSSKEVHPGSSNALDGITIAQNEDESVQSLGLDYLDSTIADLQSDASTGASSVVSQQRNDSSDSSPDDDDEEEEEEEDDDDQCSVIEMSFSASQAGITAYHQDSPQPLVVKPSSTTCKEMTVEISQVSELDQVQRKAEKSLTLDRRARSEADSDTSKASNKDRRSYSDSSQPTNKSNLSPCKLPVISQQKPQAQMFSSCSPQGKESQLSKTAETSVRSSLDTDDIIGTSRRSSDSVTFTYDIPASHSFDSESNLLKPSSGKADVFESKPAQDDMVETQMQRIIADQTPECMPVDWQDDADRKEETLAIIADLLGFSWTELARELEFSEDDIQLVRTENPNSLQEQSHALLQRWVEREGKHATEDSLIKRLTKINRMDIVHLIETQMNKSVQEQTSRTYAEIEKTLDHSEVSVALSSVQEDADSPRVVRRVESDRRPPPAVSEEDLSVASLLDIPSWAEPVGHTPSESMHGDLLEELEIPHELNPNLWTSEDIITQEPTAYDNSDEQADEIPDLPTQSVTEEKYKDENGHIVVKKVTRKIIRKCVSADDQVSLEGDLQGSVSMAQGDGYSRVVKRTVVKSEGDHTEVTFAEHEGFSATKQETREGCKVSHVERTTVVEGERTMKHQGDPSLASDLPSAQDDFKQGPHA
ncbi:uncharacterized protein ank2a isoform 2-T2 [Acanthopagrus schlegelii]